MTEELVPPAGRAAPWWWFLLPEAAEARTTGLEAVRRPGAGRASGFTATVASAFLSIVSLFVVVGGAVVRRRKIVR